MDNKKDKHSEKNFSLEIKLNDTYIETVAKHQSTSRECIIFGFLAAFAPKIQLPGSQMAM